MNCLKGKTYLGLFCGLSMFWPGAKCCGLTADTVSQKEIPSKQASVPLPDEPDKPQYMLCLTLSEFSMFNNAVVTGLGEAAGGGELNMELTIATYPQLNQPYWIASMTNPGMLPAISVWTSQELMNVVQHSDLTDVDRLSTATMAALSSLQGKIETAVKTPVWPVRVVEGVLKYKNDSPVVKLDDGQIVLLTGDTTDAIHFDGQKVRAAGSIRTPGIFHVNALAPVSTNTLEVFTMSHCPFGQQVVPALADYALRTDKTEEDPPRMNVRYIFYRISEDPNSPYFCLHGDAEMQENIVQIVIRDNLPDKFLKYLRARFRNPETPWNQLLKQTGVTPAEIGKLTSRIGQDADAIIKKEYSYVHDLCGVTDQSPTYRWNNEFIKSPTMAKSFEGLDTKNLPTQACSR